MNSYRLAVFPGQGAQFSGMGKELFEKFETHTRLANKVLGYSIEELCCGSADVLSYTEYTQPALYVVNVLSYLEAMQNQQQAPQCLAGHSLGEYCALFAAGAFSFETGLRIVAKRGSLMASCRQGAMAAVLGMSHQAVAALIEEADVDKVVMANINSPSQVVLSGDPDQLASLAGSVENASGSFHPLKVSGAFHSSYMHDIAEQFRIFLSTCMFFPLQLPVLSNVTAGFHEPDDREILVDLLVQQLYKPVLWQSLVEKLACDRQLTVDEYGPEKILTPMIAKILQA